MLQHIVAGSTLPAARAAALNPLGHLFRVVRLQQVVFTAQDVFQICGLIPQGSGVNAQSVDNLGMLNDTEFMRGLAAAFDRSDHRVLSPFQVNLVQQTFRRAGITPQVKDVVVPQADEVSPESLMGMLQNMLITHNRDDRAIKKIIALMTPLLNEFSPLHLSGTAKLLSQLNCTDFMFLAKIGKRVVETKDDFSVLELCTVAASLCFAKAPRYIIVEVLGLVEQRVTELTFDDIQLVLHGLTTVGPTYMSTLKVLATHGLEVVESLPAEVILRFLQTFVTMEYKDSAHKEIFVDALVEKCAELKEVHLVYALQAVLDLKLMSQPIFQALADRMVHHVPAMDSRNISIVMDVCSVVSYPSEYLMHALMDRAADSAMMLNAGNIGDILEILGTYPPAKDHRVVQALGRMAKRRMDLLGPVPLAKATKGLANLGYPDAEMYIGAAATHLRWGIKDFSILEPLLQGLCVSGAVADPRLVKLLGSHMIPMATSMSIQELERANRYMSRLMCDDENVFKALADRLKVFVKEVTSDVPEELQALLQRGAAHTAALEAQRQARAEARAAAF